jgi:hypothetical protein
MRAARWRPDPQLAQTTYEHWLTPHRLRGIFVAAAVAHGGPAGQVLQHSILLRVVYLIVGGVGVAAYLYRELFARYVLPIYDYTVAEVRRPNDTTRPGHVGVSARRLPA